MNAMEARGRVMMRMENMILIEQARARVMTRMEITIPLKQANAREMTRMEINHPMIMIARLRTARKSNESQNQDEDTLMTIDLKDFYLNTPMG